MELQTGLSSLASMLLDTHILQVRVSTSDRFDFYVRIEPFPEFWYRGLVFYTLTTSNMHKALAY
jgi:hypothetical protein